jgi:hypothetical protein
VDGPDQLAGAVVRRLIACVSDAGQDGRPQIWIQQIGGAALRLTNGERTIHLVPPDDTRIIFHSDDAGRMSTSSDAWR